MDSMSAACAVAVQVVPGLYLGGFRLQGHGRATDLPVLHSVQLLFSASGGEQKEATMMEWMYAKAPDWGTGEMPALKAASLSPPGGAPFPAPWHCSVSLHT